jgi:hypothetical protein
MKWYWAILLTLAILAAVVVFGLNHGDKVGEAIGQLVASALLTVNGSSRRLRSTRSISGSAVSRSHRRSRWTVWFAWDT